VILNNWRFQNHLSYDDPTPEELAELEGLDDSGGGTPGGGDPPPQDPAPEPAWQAPEYVMLGEEKVPWDKAAMWMNGGRNYSQRAAELNSTIQQRVAEATAAHQEEIGRFSHLSEVDQFAQQNPEWWEHVKSSYENRQTHGLDPQLQQALQQVIGPMQEQLKESSSFIQALQSEKAQKSEAEQDQALDQSIAGVREKFPTIDFDTPDPQTGISLETQVLQHMDKTGIYDFRAAFLDLNFDKLPDYFKSQADTQQATQVAAQRKAGVTGVSPVPAKQPEAIYQPNRRSWDDDAEQLKDELGITD